MLVTELTKDYFKVMRAGKFAVHPKRQRESGLMLGIFMLMGLFIVLIICV